MKKTLYRAKIAGREGTTWEVVMISKIGSRIWLVALIGAAILSFAPRFVHAGSGADCRERVRSDRDQDREQTEELQGQDVQVLRNMHPELQVAAPFGTKE